MPPGSSWWPRPQPCQHHREILAQLSTINGSLRDLHRKADHLMTASDDLNASVGALGAEITTFLNDLAGQIAGGLTAAQAEAVVTQINGFTAQLQNADPATQTPPVPPVSN
jgi:hypothetical protein